MSIELSRVIMKVSFTGCSRTTVLRLISMLDWTAAAAALAAAGNEDVRWAQFRLSGWNEAMKFVVARMTNYFVWEQRTWTSYFRSPAHGRSFRAVTVGSTCIDIILASFATNWHFDLLRNETSRYWDFCEGSRVVKNNTKSPAVAKIVARTFW